jgi:hypothetical protein
MIRDVTGIFRQMPEWGIPENAAILWDILAFSRGYPRVESLDFNFFVVDEFKNFCSRSFELIKEKQVGK